MKLKGHVKIELTDTASGAVETVEKDNMITNAVNHLLGLNPMGVFYAAGGEYDTHLQWNGELLPICPNMIGGLLLFANPIEENADNIFQYSANMPVAYASNDVNSTANPARGSLNLSESKELENGYKFVWEFSPSQGNGTIAAVALTSARGGQNGFGSLAGDASPFLLIKSVDIGELDNSKQMLLFEAVEVDFEKDLVYSMTFEDSSVKVRTIRMPIFTIGLNERMDDSTYKIVDERVIPVSAFQFLGNSWTGMMVTGMDFPMRGILPEVQR